MEIWKTIDGFENLYEVSNLGRVRSLFRYKKILKPNCLKSGYQAVSLYKNKKKYLGLIHRLVAIAFIPNPLNKPQVNHIDEIKSNNHVENLEWMTAKENMSYGTARERTNKAQGQKVIQLDINGKMISQFDTENIASQMTGANRYKISAVINGHRKTAGGYLWKKVGEV
ncbi:NUMOD4 domain-containing protein [Companilactobacillus sp. HBUAS56257]|uniref:NUMOD4 domain-containing protein n=1 Tax=Companilactobacillus sp. HBUAS56257 TaxID=3109360 RepID=UPI002FF1E73D